MHTFEYLKPKTIDEAISLMESHGERARYIVGGTDILVKIKEEKVLPDFFISLGHIPDLAYIRYEEAKGILRIGSMTTHRILEKSSLIRRRYPILSDAVDNIGSFQIRNVGTIGGNIVNAVPSADGAIPLITLGAKGIGEPGCVPTAAAIANAIYDAIGIRIFDLPITPEKILKALREREDHKTQ